MWSDKDIDNAFHWLNPPDPDPMPFPLDAWLRLETQLDKAVFERAVRRKLWRFFAAEVAVVALIALGWLLWLTKATVPIGTVAEKTNTTANGNVLNIKHLPNNTGRAAILHTATATTTSAALAAASASSAAANSPAPTRSSSTQATTAAGRPAPRAAAARPLPLLAAAIPRERSRGYQRPAERLTKPHGLAVSVVITPASRKGLRKAEGSLADAPRRAAGSTAASATGNEPAARQTAQTVTEASSASSENNSAYAPPATSRQHKEKMHESVQEPAVVQASATALATALTSAGADNQTDALSWAALTPQPVALEPTAAPELPAPLVAVASAPSETVLPLPPPQPRFYVGLVAAPDVSTVKFAGVQSPLLNVGVTFEYRLTNRLRLSTGLLRAPKQYTARRGDYDWGDYHNLVYQHDFEYVDGNCTVVDVPLNLRYDLLSRPEYRIFGSAGLSSYFMQREEYSYNWVDQRGPGAWERYAINENRNLLGIINLSFGYERSLGTRWSVQAEPYLKIPLNGVGVGKVQLVSGGVFFGAKYGF